MSPRNIFIIILRVMGLLIIKDMLFSVITIVTFFFNDSYRDSYEMGWQFLLAAAILTIGYGVFHLLMFKTGVVVDKLKLDQGFEKSDFSFFEKKEAGFDIHYLPLINLAILITGLYILINEIPQLISNISVYYKTIYFTNTGRNSGLVVSVSKIVLGYILVKAHAPISNFIDNKRRQNNINDDSKD